MMPDYSKLKEMVAQLREQTEAMAEEVARLEQGGENALAASFDLSKVIPPTRGDGPQPIIGGVPTRDFPDCCAVGSDEEYYCTGTLIAPTLVVTAQHCLDVTRVFLKGHDVSDPESGETIPLARKDGRTVQFVHPSEDLRILVLERPSSVAPRHVAQGFEVRGETALLVGFGRINFSGTVGYGVKRKVEVPILSLDCNAQAAGAYGCNSGAEIVAGHRGLNRDSCKGDSGGPLYITGPDGDDYLLGVTSRGVKNADRVCGDGGIYVRVDLCLDWIRGKTGVEIEGPRL
jgi:hypothetical protein